MKTTKRIFSILIVLCMLVGTIGVLPVSVFAEDTTPYMYKFFVKKKIATPRDSDFTLFIV